MVSEVTHLGPCAVKALGNNNRWPLRPQEITTLLPFSGISLDILQDSSDLGADLSDYIHHRVNGSTQVAANVTTPTGSAPDQLLLSKFSSHLSTRSHGSILYLQLTLDLFHKAHLVLKGGNYLVVPVSLSEVNAYF